VATALEIWFDLRVPEGCGSKPREIYAAAVDMCAWADSLGFQAMSCGEHHISHDNFLPSPITFASIVGGRTRNLDLRIVLLAPFYDPIRLAEDLAVLNLTTGGRALPVLCAGYRKTEFALYGIRHEERAALVSEAVEVLRNVWSGRPFRYRDRDIGVVTPLPDPVPRILMGAMTPMMTRRAAQIADGFSPGEHHLYRLFVEERVKLGKPPPMPYPNSGTDFIYITEDPERAWEMLLPYWTHSGRMYERWAEENGQKICNRFPIASNKDELKANPIYQVLTPEACIEYAESLGSNGELRFQPMPGGLHPALAWKSLKLFETQVLPHLKIKRTENLLY
jgi:alkanesulfonate monooxygenase SsuD/methylene tetrahydromethanopterin reductase-like flavin-dependent oxidoreductase (luciferase family)